jgi:hypothetical protein
VSVLILLLVVVAFWGGLHWLLGHVLARPVTVDRYGPFLSPHPLRRPVLHVDCASEADAWAAITEKSA